MKSDESDIQEYVEGQYSNSSNLATRVLFHDRFSVNHYGWIPWVSDQLKLKPDTKILELGCGGGGLWKRNLERIPDGCEILLTDFTEGMVQDAKKNLAGNSIFEFKIVDANDNPLPFPDTSFDVVIANHMLNYISDRQGLFSEIVRILKPGGRFYSSAIGEQHVVEMKELIRELDPVLGASWGNVVSSFNLENGLDQLSPWFKDISLRCYEDALEVTEVNPYFDYILSTKLIDWGEDKREKFKKLIKQKMDSQGGVLHITKDGGIFKAIRM